jgi:hypothetical protein
MAPFLVLPSFVSDFSMHLSNIVYLMRFLQQPFERFELTHLDMNVLTID